MQNWHYLLIWITCLPVCCQSVVDRIQKDVRLFQYSNCLQRKSNLKLANWIFANVRDMRVNKREGIWNIKKASHLFCIDQQITFWPNFISQNLSNLYTLLILLKQGNPCKTKAQVLDSSSFESFSHLIKAAVNWVMPLTNETHVLDTLEYPQQK